MIMCCLDCYDYDFRIGQNLDLRTCLKVLNSDVIINLKRADIHLDGFRNIRWQALNFNGPCDEIHNAVIDFNAFRFADKLEFGDKTFWKLLDG